MAINYKPGKSPFYTDDEVLTEQEHLDSCDINKMVYAAARLPSKRRQYPSLWV